MSWDGQYSISIRHNEVIVSRTLWSSNNSTKLLLLRFISWAHCTSLFVYLCLVWRLNKQYILQGVRFDNTPEDIIIHLAVKYNVLLITTLFFTLHYSTMSLHTFVLVLTFKQYGLFTVVCFVVSFSNTSMNSSLLITLLIVSL